MQSSKERNLVKKIQKGNEKAFKKLYDQYASYALRTAFAMTKNNADASDIVQETFIRVYRNIDSFDVKMPFKPWFYRILINEGKRVLDKRKREAMPIESNENLDAIQQTTDRKPMNGKILEALDHVSDDDRTLMILKYVDRFTEKELAETMGINVNTLKSRLLRARKRLKEVYAGGEFHDGP